MAESWYSTSQRWRHYEYYDYLCHLSFHASSFDDRFFTVWKNFLCHYIVPLWFLADTIIFDKSRQYKLVDPMLWTSLPLLYMIFALLNGFVLKMDVPNAKDSPFPYFFLNATKHGWGFVFKWAATIFVAYMVSGYLFYLVKSIKKSKK